MIILLPALDEADHLPGVLTRIAASGLQTEIVVVDDGSQDETAEVARSHGATVLSHPFNLGYGAAIQTGYKYALRRGVSSLVQMDADGQHDPSVLRNLLAPIERGEFDLVLGSRFVEDTGYQMGTTRTLGRRLLRMLGSIAGVDVSDPTTGLQAMNRRVLKLYTRDFFPPDYPDVDVLATAARSGIRILEVPAAMNEGGRPSRLHGGLRGFYYAYKMLLSIWAAMLRRETLQ